MAWYVLRTGNLLVFYSAAIDSSCVQVISVENTQECTREGTSVRADTNERVCKFLRMFNYIGMTSYVKISKISFLTKIVIF